MKTLRHLAHRISVRLRTDGFAATLRFCGARVRSRWRSGREDRRRGVSTSREVKDRELGIRDLRNHWYVATDYETFARAMEQVEVRAGEDVFVDFGSGMGRIVMLAAGLPFRRVIGVEFAPQLHVIAQQNVAAAGCRNVELVQADATEWRIPADASVLFFFNPFEGEILRRVFANIRRSVEEHPRHLRIVYVRPEKFFEHEVPWRDWLTRTASLPCLEGLVNIYESNQQPLAAHPPVALSCTTALMEVTTV
jgi:hypothetical protein